MNSKSRVAFARVIREMILADGIIDTGELQSLQELRDSFGITPADEQASAGLTLEQAAGALRDLPDQQRRDIVDCLRRVAMSDDICAREEALLFMAMEDTLMDEGMIVSLPDGAPMFDPEQIIYLESEYDAEANAQLDKDFRIISQEMRLSGFSLIYVPRFTAMCKELDADTLRRAVGLFIPAEPEQRQDYVVSVLCGLSTASLCRLMFVDRMKMESLRYAEPAMLVPLPGEGGVANFWLLSVGECIEETVCQFAEKIGRLSPSRILPYRKQENGRLLATGYFHAITSVLAMRQGVRSTILIDLCRGTICFPEAGAELAGLSRREKALYTLFLVEAASQGINFQKPEITGKLAQYTRRMNATMAKYRILYRKFGGMADEAPDLGSQKMRGPMLSHIKAAIGKVADKLKGADDYVVKRNIYKNYYVSLPTELFFAKDTLTGEVKSATDTDWWKALARM